MEVPMTDEIAKRMGFVNVAAFEEYQKRKGDLRSLDQMSIDICNMKQTLIKMGANIMDLNNRLISTGTERIECSG